MGVAFSRWSACARKPDGFPAAPAPPCRHYRGMWVRLCTAAAGVLPRNAGGGGGQGAENIRGSLRRADQRKTVTPGARIIAGTYFRITFLRIKRPDKIIPEAAGEFVEKVFKKKKI